MKTLKYLFPFTYFFNTRVKGVIELIFHFSFEWLPNILIFYFLLDFSAFDSIVNFVLTYLAFISIYEIGYIANDVHSVRNESNPRLRLGKFKPNNVTIFIWVGIRLFFFLIITYVIGAQDSQVWWAFYALLFIVFFLHNILKIKYMKVFTFINLAFLRFMASGFFYFAIMDSEILMKLLPGIFLYYVLYRSISYMSSKNILNIKQRESDMFKVSFYLFLLPLSGLISILMNDFIPVLHCLYYLLIVLSFVTINKIKTQLF